MRRPHAEGTISRFPWTLALNGYELVRSIMSGVQRTEVWEGPASLDFFPAPDNELDALQPVAVRRGYRYSMSMTIEDLEVLETLG